MLAGEKKLNFEVNKPIAKIIGDPNFEIVVFETHEMLKYAHSRRIRV